MLRKRSLIIIGVVLVALIMIGIGSVPQTKTVFPPEYDIWINGRWTPVTPTLPPPPYTQRSIQENKD